MNYIEIQDLPSHAHNSIYTASSYPVGVYSYLGSIYLNTGVYVLLLDSALQFHIKTKKEGVAPSNTGLSEDMLLKAIAISQRPELAKELTK